MSPEEISKHFERQEWDIQFVSSFSKDYESNKKSTLFIGRDGRFLLRKNLIGTFGRKFDDKGAPSLDDVPDSFFKFHLPKIPSYIFKKQVAFYRKVMEIHDNAEAYSTIMYDLEKKEYILVIPEQEVSGGFLKYSQEKLREEYPSRRYLEVVSCHSHNNMNAFFSSVDDNDEKGDMLYMVIGKLNQDAPEFKIRANVAGKECLELTVQDVLDFDQEFWNLNSPEWKPEKVYIPKDWIEKVSKLKGVISAHSSSGHKTDWSNQLKEWFKNNTRDQSRTISFNTFGQSKQGCFEWYGGRNTWVPGVGLPEPTGEGSLVKILQGIGRKLVLDAGKLGAEQAVDRLMGNLVRYGLENEILEALSDLQVFPSNTFPAYLDPDFAMVQEMMEEEEL